jgi:hypothetical protein
MTHSELFKVPKPAPGLRRKSAVVGKEKVLSRCSFLQDYYREVMLVPYDTIMGELAEGRIFLSNPVDFAVGMSSWQERHPPHFPPLPNAQAIIDLKATSEKC